MKLWYQSLTREAQWPAYNRALRTLLDSAADEGTTIEIHGIADRGGIGDQFRYLEFIETIEVLNNAARAEREGFDAFLIGNIADPGLVQARELVSIPVLALCETSCHIASMMGETFAAVTANDKHRPRVVENVRRYGLESRLFGTGRMNVERLVDLDQGYVNPAVRENLLTQFRAAADDLAERGAEVIIPAAGVVMALIADAKVYEVARGVPVLNGVVALVKMAELAVKMNRLLGGRFTSRRCLYAQPPLGQMAELRSFYGDIYPALGGDKPAKAQAASPHKGGQ